jgi:hypothetical protein
MLLNPEQFSIIQSKEMGIWPPSDLIADSMYPYIKRMPQKANILDVGTMKGENAYRFLELDTKNKIDTIFTVRTTNEYDDLVSKNINSYPDKMKFCESKEPVDLVCINSNTDLDTTLKTYYDLVKTNGIFCGNNHSHKNVKEALTKFRRSSKIGTPILVAHDIWFWHRR